MRISQPAGLLGGGESAPIFYAGIGSRSAPSGVLRECRSAAKSLAALGLILRSGGAKGCDQAFEAGCDLGKGEKEVFYPKRRLHPTAKWDEAYKLAKEHHEYWNSCTDFGKMLHTRNGFQVLGAQLDLPVSFVLCWTPDGCESGPDTTQSTGGTGQAIRIATAYDIPIINIYHDGWAQRVKDQLISLGVVER